MKHQKCLGCYKADTEGYCNACRKRLFDGRKISHILSFETPNTGNLTAYQEKTKRLSISGIQLKYSLKMEGKELVLTEKGGRYILKPVPLALLVMPEQTPENEHLTMQMARQIFNVPVAENALIYFKDNQPAYITRRFDVKEDGTKHLQEDFAQISGKTKNTDGDHYKYSGTYEHIGRLIKQKVAASLPVLEEYFRVVVFNYIFSNGDAHLKNFSLVQTEFGDYVLSKAYDLICTVLHTPNEEDTALDLYEGDTDSDFYQTYGYYGRPNFEELARRMGLMERRAQQIIDAMLAKQNEVHAMAKNSFLSDEAKAKYIQVYEDKIRRIK